MLHLVNDARPGVAAHVVTFLGLAAVAGTACRVMLAPMADNGDRVVAAAVRLAAILRFSAEEEAAGEEWSAPPTPTPTQGARPRVGYPDTFSPLFSSLHSTCLLYTSDAADE